jgi:hypothetical protein
LESVNTKLCCSKGRWECVDLAHLYLREYLAKPWACRCPLATDASTSVVTPLRVVACDLEASDTVVRESSERASETYEREACEREACDAVTSVPVTSVPVTSVPVTSVPVTSVRVAVEATDRDACDCDSCDADAVDAVVRVVPVACEPASERLPRVDAERCDDAYERVAVTSVPVT